MESKTPTWAIIVAILMMLMGGCGVKNNIQSINIRSILAMKDNLFNNIDNKKKLKEQDTLGQIHNSKDTLTLTNSNTPTTIDSMVADTSDRKENGEDMQAFRDMFGTMLDLPESTIQKIIYFGYFGFIFSLLFLIGGLFLLKKRNFSIHLAYGVIGANILFYAVKWIMFANEGNTFITIGTSFGVAVTIFMCIILLVVIISSDKTHYETQLE
jgi:hypothetical protein